MIILSQALDLNSAYKKEELLDIFWAKILIRIRFICKAARVHSIYPYDEKLQNKYMIGRWAKQKGNIPVTINFILPNKFWIGQLKCLVYIFVTSFTEQLSKQSNDILTSYTK